MLSRSSWLLLTILFDLLLIVGAVQARADSALYLPGIVQVERDTTVHAASPAPLAVTSPLPTPAVSQPPANPEKLVWFCSADIEGVIGQRLPMLIGCR